MSKQPITAVEVSMTQCIAWVDIYRGIGNPRTVFIRWHYSPQRKRRILARARQMQDVLIMNLESDITPVYHDETGESYY